MGSEKIGITYRYTGQLTDSPPLEGARLVILCQKHLIGAGVLLPGSGMMHMLRIIFANRILGNMRNGMFDKTNDKPRQRGGGQREKIVNMVNPIATANKKTPHKIRT